MRVIVPAVVLMVGCLYNNSTAQAAPENTGRRVQGSSSAAPAVLDGTGQQARAAQQPVPGAVPPRDPRLQAPKTRGYGYTSEHYRSAAAQGCAREFRSDRLAPMRPYIWRSGSSQAF